MLSKVLAIAVLAAAPILSRAGPIQMMGEHNRDQIIVNTQHIQEIDRRLTEVEIRMNGVITGLQGQEVRLALIDTQLKDVLSKMNLITGILVTLWVGLAIRIAYDVITGKGPGRRRPHAG